MLVAFNFYARERGGKEKKEGKSTKMSGKGKRKRERVLVYYRVSCVSHSMMSKDFSLGTELAALLWEVKQPHLHSFPLQSHALICLDPFIQFIFTQTLTEQNKLQGLF